MDIYEEYKDSGIDWVGKVPASWKRSRIKFLLSHSSAGVCASFDMSFFSVTFPQMVTLFVFVQQTLTILTVV